MVYDSHHVKGRPFLSSDYHVITFHIPKYSVLWIGLRSPCILSLTLQNFIPSPQNRDAILQEDISNRVVNSIKKDRLNNKVNKGREIELGQGGNF